jgi:hypothetical protein
VVTFTASSRAASADGGQATVGTFTLLAGDYLIIAVDDGLAGAWGDPAFLEKIAPATKVTIGGARRKSGLEIVSAMSSRTNALARLVVGLGRRLAVPVRPPTGAGLPRRCRDLRRCASVRRAIVTLTSLLPTNRRDGDGRARRVYSLRAGSYHCGVESAYLDVARCKATRQPGTALVLLGASRHECPMPLALGVEGAASCATVSALCPAYHHRR